MNGDSSAVPALAPRTDFDNKSPEWRPSLGESPAAPIKTVGALGDPGLGTAGEQVADARCR